MMLSTALPRWWSGRKCHGMQLWLTDVVWGLWEKKPCLLSGRAAHLRWLRESRCSRGGQCSVSVPL